MQYHTCVESNFSNFECEDFRENEFLSKTIVACLSGAQVGSMHEINRGRKSRDTASLSIKRLYCGRASQKSKMLFIFDEECKKSMDN